MDNLIKKVKKVLEEDDPHIVVRQILPTDDEPFLLKARTDVEIADYDSGFQASTDGQPSDDTKSLAWQRGWVEAQEIS